jgi:TusA-related sulfurtransferase
MFAASSSRTLLPGVNFQPRHLFTLYPSARRGGRALEATETEARMDATSGGAADDATLPRVDATLELLGIANSGALDGATCAILTPAIRAKLREMEAGQVLEVRVDDSSARGDLESWCRLSGNTLLAAREEPPGILRAWLRKKDG